MPTTRPNRSVTMGADCPPLRRSHLDLFILSFLCLYPLQFLSAAAGTTAVIHAQPLHSGRISPMLFGNFVELLDDVVPSMWAEILNGRSFEGVTRAANWSYYDGKPDFCDREWDHNPTWSCDTDNPFNGTLSARLTATRHPPASLTQGGLAMKRGMDYEFSGR